VVSFGGRNHLGRHNFSNWFIVVSFAFDSYYDDLVSTAAFTLFTRPKGNG
jgi:hypothetical protein